MAYQAIYRKWRPLIFDDIIGQTHITQTLKNQVMSERTTHAYLFCGTRGTGKTTAAKVLSRAVNCEHPVDGSPCNQCATCRGILDGSILDISEIDAASNNGVDNIRDILEDVNYVATQTKYRVYIIDEVHMLSTGAFNALLKTLEEPPEHVIFILATTEAHKVPETILSRCQRFDFKRITPNNIIVRMKEIATGDGINISEDAYPLLASFADGSMRDGLSILERCVSACGNNITYDSVISVLGATPIDTVISSADALINKNTSKILNIMNDLSQEGKNLNVYIDSLCGHFRDLIVLKVSNEPEKLIQKSAEEMGKLKAQAEKATFSKISRAIDILTSAKADAKWLKNPRTVYELSLIKLTQPELDSSTEALLERIEQLEEQIKNGVVKVVEEKKEEIKKPEEEKKVKKEVSSRLYVPINPAILTSSSPVVQAARKWDRTAQAIAKKYPYIAGSVLNRKITIDCEGIILIYQEGETMLKKIASTYIKSIQTESYITTGVDLVFKTCYYEDIEDNIIDFWQIPNDASSDNSDSPDNSIGNSHKSSDPLDVLIQNTPEIIELTDSTDFIGHKPEPFEQIDIEEDERDIDEEKLLEEYKTDED